MAKRRKDSKGRILKDNEYQRKDGKYEYKYEDLDGNRKSVYSWKLEPGDYVPVGKRCGASLREIEKDIADKLHDGVIVSAKETTLNDLFKLHMDLITLSNATAVNYQYMWKHLIEDSIGRRDVTGIKKSDIQRFYAAQKKKGMKNGTIQILQKMIRPSLQIAVDDNLIKSNPADGCCKNYAEKETVKEVLTREQVEIFMSELRKYRARQNYEPFFRILLGLALRRGELIGLTWNDVNMKERTVSINHSVLYREKDGKKQFYAKETKTGNVRVIPMSQEVYKYFKELHQNRFLNHSTVEIDGYKDFVFTSLNGMPLYPDNLNHIMIKVVERYNRNADVPLPKISNHTFRHTGCTRMAEAGVDMNTLCYIMGHSNYKMIMQVYDHVNLERARNQIKKLDASVDRAV